jgi:hypothetical protein
MLEATNLVEPARPDLRLAVLIPLPQEDTSGKLAVLMTGDSPSDLPNEDNFGARQATCEEETRLRPRADDRSGWGRTQ